MPTAGRGAPPPARRRHHHRRSVLLSCFHGRVVVSAVDGTRGRIMVVKRAVPISTLELQSRVEHADAMATRRSRWSLCHDNRMVVASRRRGGHGRDGRRFAATKRSRSSLRDDDIDDEVVMSWWSPLRGDEAVAVVASRRDDDMMAVASRRRGGHGGDGRRFAATRWSQLYFRRLTPIFLPCFYTVWTNDFHRLFGKFQRIHWLSVVSRRTTEDDT